MRPPTRGDLRVAAEEVIRQAAGDDAIRVVFSVRVGMAMEAAMYGVESSAAVLEWLALVLMCRDAAGEGGNHRLGRETIYREQVVDHRGGVLADLGHASAAPDRGAHPERDLLQRVWEKSVRLPRTMAAHVAISSPLQKTCTVVAGASIDLAADEPPRHRLQGHTDLAWMSGPTVGVDQAASTNTFRGSGLSSSHSTASNTPPGRRRAAADRNGDRPVVAVRLDQRQGQLPQPSVRQLREPLGHQHRPLDRRPAAARPHPGFQRRGQVLLHRLANQAQAVGDLALRAACAGA